MYLCALCTLCICVHYVLVYSKPALLEGLEVDQYMWSVVQNQLCQDTDEVQIDALANMKPFSVKVRGEKSLGPIVFLSGHRIITTRGAKHRRLFKIFNLFAFLALGIAGIAQCTCTYEL